VLFGGGETILFDDHDRSPPTLARPYPRAGMERVAIILGFAFAVVTILDIASHFIRKTVEFVWEVQDRRATKHPAPPVQVEQSPVRTEPRVTDVMERLRTRNYPAARPGLMSVARAVSGGTATLDPPGLTAICAGVSGGSARLS
jgi:hypothetical protein